MVGSQTVCTRARGLVPPTLMRILCAPRGVFRITYGVPDVPIRWRLWYSHAQVETLDLHDMLSPAAMVQAVAEGC